MQEHRLCIYTTLFSDSLFVPDIRQDAGQHRATGFLRYFCSSAWCSFDMVLAHRIRTSLADPGQLVPTIVSIYMSLKPGRATPSIMPGSR